jgi:hypothetical protein
MGMDSQRTGVILPERKKSFSSPQLLDRLWGLFSEG